MRIAGTDSVFDDSGQRIDIARVRRGLMVIGAVLIQTYNQRAAMFSTPCIGLFSDVLLDAKHSCFDPVDGYNRLQF